MRLNDHCVLATLMLLPGIIHVLFSACLSGVNVSIGAATVDVSGVLSLSYSYVEARVFFTYQKLVLRVDRHAIGSQQ